MSNDIAVPRVTADRRPDASTAWREHGHGVGLACGRAGTEAAVPSRRRAIVTIAGLAAGAGARQAMAEASKVLLVYFSRAGENYWNGGRRQLEVGNTQRLARMIADRVACDSWEIIAADPYPDSYDETVARSHREKDADARPAIAGRLPDTSGFDTILLGSPVWASRAPMIMSSFIDTADLAGKTILPFVTYAVSGMSGIDDDYRAALARSKVGAGLAVRGEDVADAGPRLDRWVERHRLPARTKQR